MPFLNLNRVFPTALAFATWLATQPRPQWPPRGATYHNTYKPNADTWAGHASMESMQRTYERLGWDRGPHVYLAVGTKHDGIWVMTPPHLPGIHSPSCNGLKTKPGRFGIEVVGDFGQVPMTEAQLQLLVDVAAALHRYAQIPANLNAHRDCDVRTCPGNAAYAQKPELQRRLAAALAPPVPPPTPTRYTELSPLMGAPTVSLETVALRFPIHPASAYSDLFIQTTILPAYWELAQTVRLDPLVAIAQMGHETEYLTAFWSQPPQHNPAGIGVTGQYQAEPPRPQTGWAYNTQRQRWEVGITFLDWPIAIRAHVGRLVAYATKPGARTPQQQQLVSEALSWRPLPITTQGSAQVLKQLGKAHNPSGQGWASPGTDYGARLAGVANRLSGAP